jgi:UTP--glucose-1-phosphate uridylyltransferase
MIAVENIPREKTSKYGIVDSETLGTRVGKLKGIVEKPKADEAPSTEAVVSRYMLTPLMFDLPDDIGQGAGGEIQLTDAIAELLKKEKVYSLAFEGKRYDCGSKFGYLRTTVEYALKHPDLKDEFSNYLVNKGYLQAMK